jgi:hypothetical protein
MSMKWMGCLNHDLQHNPSEKPRESPTTACDCETSISGWGCILMTANRSMRCGNTLYVYGEDLMRVWGGWSASISYYNSISFCFDCESKHISGWGCILTIYSRSSRLNRITYMILIFYEFELGGVQPTSESKWETKRITYCCYAVTLRQNFLGAPPRKETEKSVGIHISLSHSLE